jgi:ribose 5-phosphate isomerase B
LKVSLACDHGGFYLKKFIAEWLNKNNFYVIDLGNEVYDIDDDYPDFAEKAAWDVVSGSSDRAIVICGSGVGACITANKVKGARASVCHDTYSARQGVEHDNMNILCLGARIIGEQLALELVKAFLGAAFINVPRYNHRLDKINKLENNK